MRAVRSRVPQVSFTGLGLSRMEEAGLEPLEEEEGAGGAMWLHNLLKIRYFWRMLGRCKEYIRSGKPDLVVLVDYGGFNMFLAKAASEAGVPVLYYIPPQVWAHGAHRAKKLKKWVTRLAVIYPFEKEFYESRGIEAEYVGHPLFDELEQNPPREEKVKELGEGREKLIGLFPGSRRQEVKRHLPVTLDACLYIADRWPGARFAIVCPEGVNELAREMGRKREDLRLEFPDATPAEVARASWMCLTKSGTITLEVASQGCPMIIFYRVNPFSHFVASGLRRTPWIGLVNVLADREVCPERLMWRKNKKWLARTAMELGSDRKRYQACRQDLQNLMEGFARPGASERTADIVVDMLG